jgi:hypothetical protein
MSNSGTLSSNRQLTAYPKYNHDISLLISLYVISESVYRSPFPGGFGGAVG